MDVFDNDLLDVSLAWKDSLETNPYKVDALESFHIDMEFSGADLDFSTNIPLNMEDHLNSLREKEPERYSCDFIDSGINTPEPQSPLMKQEYRLNNAWHLDQIDSALNSTSAAMFNLSEPTNQDSDLDNLEDIESALQVGLLSSGSDCSMNDGMLVDDFVSTINSSRLIRTNGSVDNGMISIDPSMLKLNSLYGNMARLESDVDMGSMNPLDTMEKPTISLFSDSFTSLDSLKYTAPAAVQANNMSHQNTIPPLSSGIPPLVSLSPLSTVKNTYTSPATVKLENVAANTIVPLNQSPVKALQTTSVNQGSQRKGLVKTSSTSSVSSLDSAKRHQPYPKRNSERKRQLHNELERKRREDLNSTFNHLGEVIPSLKASGTPTQLQILKGAAVYLAELKERSQRLTSSKDQLRAENSRLQERLEVLRNLRAETHQQAAFI
ncbi:hypothetical protein SARC_03242 [Sphaeroforma arctica JP610]|uniref:BHLH domain-containing protein n=1 Tax=Sphaeroforma arctica JP610 TaxID=667725 RepID=A0A0L0G6F8_9EUKA|nr:hypothetical protein SARC_03242 [Sphaeroforma arctica JP610]KNC84539.1 hypothetical protein SARC_03242 [Sphaeroforma arctica JP610]|eukprot:XP_014158441.1 hypothetical protein SARC_03242 [Sphaeroforma arctica JP610]